MSRWQKSLARQRASDERKHRNRAPVALMVDQPELDFLHGAVGNAEHVHPELAAKLLVKIDNLRIKR